MAFINTNLRHVGTVGSGQGCTLPGVTHGYVCGGFLGKPGNAPSWGPAVYGRMIDKFYLTSEGNASDIADLATGRDNSSGYQI